jgi:hypothetical protein
MDKVIEWRYILRYILLNMGWCSDQRYFLIYACSLYRGILSEGFLYGSLTGKANEEQAEMTEFFDTLRNLVIQYGLKLGYSYHDGSGSFWCGHISHFDAAGISIPFPQRDVHFYPMAELSLANRGANNQN